MTWLAELVATTVESGKPVRLELEAFATTQVPVSVVGPPWRVGHDFIFLRASSAVSAKPLELLAQEWARLMTPTTDDDPDGFRLVADVLERLMMGSEKAADFFPRLFAVVLVLANSRIHWTYFNCWLLYRLLELARADALFRLFRADTSSWEKVRAVMNADSWQGAQLQRDRPDVDRVLTDVFEPSTPPTTVDLNSLDYQSR